jgi:hypothetical protein
MQERYYKKANFTFSASHLALKETYICTGIEMKRVTVSEPVR